MSRLKPGRQSIEQRMLHMHISRRERKDLRRYQHTAEEKAQGRARRKVDLLAEVDALGVELMEVWE